MGNSLFPILNNSLSKLSENVCPSLAFYFHSKMFRNTSCSWEMEGVIPEPKQPVTLRSADVTLSALSRQIASFCISTSRPVDLCVFSWSNLCSRKLSFNRRFSVVSFDVQCELTYYLALKHSMYPAWRTESAKWVGASRFEVVIPYDWYRPNRRFAIIQNLSTRFCMFSSPFSAQPDLEIIFKQ